MDQNCPVSIFPDAAKGCALKLCSIIFSDRMSITRSWKLLKVLGIGRQKWFTDFFVSFLCGWVGGWVGWRDMGVWVWGCGDGGRRWFISLCLHFQYSGIHWAIITKLWAIFCDMYCVGHHQTTKYLQSAFVDSRKTLPKLCKWYSTIACVHAHKKAFWFETEIETRKLCYSLWIQIFPFHVTYEINYHRSHSSSCIIPESLKQFKCDSWYHSAGTMAPVWHHK